MIEPGEMTKKMEEAIEQLKDTIINEVNEWEAKTGIWVSSMNYVKTARVRKCEIDVDLKMTGGG